MKVHVVCNIAILSSSDSKLILLICTGVRGLQQSLIGVRLKVLKFSFHGVQNNSNTPGFDSRTVQTVAIRSNAYAILTHKLGIIFSKFYLVSQYVCTGIGYC